MRKLLADRGLSRNAFARMLKVHPQFLVKVYNGECAVPKRSMDKWIKLLALTGEERQRFEDAALWSQLTPRQRTWALEYFDRS